MKANARRKATTLDRGDSVGLQSTKQTRVDKCLTLFTSSRHYQIARPLEDHLSGALQKDAENSVNVVYMVDGGCFPARLYESDMEQTLEYVNPLAELRQIVSYQGNFGQS